MLKSELLAAIQREIQSHDFFALSKTRQASTRAAKALSCLVQLPSSTTYSS